MFDYFFKTKWGRGGGGEAESGLSPDEYLKVFQLLEISRHAPFRACQIYK